jgi:hypothetical protein
MCRKSVVSGTIIMGLIKGFSDPEDELYDAVYREVASLRRAPDSESQTFATDLEALQCMAGSSVQEIDRLLGELQTIRDLLKVERERVQHELDEYTHLSQSSLQSTKIIAESLAPWKRALASTSPSS